MSTPREELHALIDELSDKAAADLLPELRLLKMQAEARSERAPSSGAWPPAWFGSIDGTPPDLTEHIDEILSAEFGRSPK
ncbi:hypothetical protein [Kribbella shirazensis]|uniref:DUF2281 domain-containing protein n=1 Tax=Kribbella shirazensis TaxID=1105143 RepID=A0A7X5V9X6_9ACTN|nr:hypothetical protein [Kribbella shirazensis]NIK56896.1 hypothetical protein [Kribbella shirazensis]